MKEKNFGLSEAEFINLTKKLKSGDETIFETIFLSQFEQSMHYLRVKYKASHETAYDTCMDTLIQFRKLILTDKIRYGNLRILFTAMTSQRYIKVKNRNKKIVYQEALPEVATDLNLLDAAELNFLSKAWEKLGQDCQFILKHYYYNKTKLLIIAEMLGKTASAVRKQK